jgi:PBSX family phage terminase large subunit
LSASPTISWYQPYGSAIDLFKSRQPEIMVSGPAGTGKSRACLEKLHLLAMKYGGMRGLMVRKTRESLSESGLVTFEDKVLTPNDRIKDGPQRRMRQIYSYHNDSEIVVGGMDKAGKIMSTEFDAIYVQEATELTEDDWESLTTRLRNGVVPYQQIIGDCNPSSNSHWLKKRAERGGLLMLESRHEDNPSIWDVRRGRYTIAGQAYIDTLDRLTGVRKQRLRYGIWAAAEGMVYEDVWNPAIHMIDAFDVPASWPRYWSIDFGFTNPFVWQEWAQDPDGRLYRVKEIYYTQRLVEDHAREILAATKDSPRPAGVICDHDAEGRATLEKYLGVTTITAYKAVQDGIQAVAARFKVAGDGKARLFYMRDALVERDPKLEEAKKPACTEEEVEGYIWDTSNKRKTGEEPVKKDDHGCDATRYLVAFVDNVGDQKNWSEFA